MLKVSLIKVFQPKRERDEVLRKPRTDDEFFIKKEKKNAIQPQNL